MTRPKPPRATGDRWLGAFITVIFLVLVASIMALVWNTKLQDLDPSWRAANGEGIPGTFVATETYEVGRRTHLWKGTFTSDDGSVHRGNVQLDSAPPDMELGEPVPALDTGAHDVVYVPGADYPLVTNLMCLSCLACPLVLLMLLVARRLLRRRRGSPAEGPHTPEA